MSEERVIPEGTAPDRRGIPRWIPFMAGAVVFVLALVFGGALMADWGLRNVEMRDLVSAIENSEREMMQTQDEVTAALQPFEVGGALTPEETDALRGKLVEIARGAETRIQSAGERVAEVRIQPWHRAISDAQLAYLVHNQAWVRYMAAAANDPIEFLNPQPLVNQTFLDAEPIMVKAVPIPPLFDLDKRVAQIFIDGIPEEMELDADPESIGASSSGVSLRRS
jgi:hypothetical protein